MVKVKAAATVTVPPNLRSLLEGIGQIAARQVSDAYAVGGCVRDWLLGRSSAMDVDIAVGGSGIELARAVARRGGRVEAVHEQFGTATVRLGARRVDFATCRLEIYTRPAAYPKVSEGCLFDDLFRRDFTINAMALALAPSRFGRLTDPFHGQRDVRQRILRVIHQRSFLDDPSRILRGIRFAQRFRLRWDLETERLAREAVAAGALGWLNAGRLQRELDAMLDEPDPAACLGQLAAFLGA